MAVLTSPVGRCFFRGWRRYLLAWQVAVLIAASFTLQANFVWALGTSQVRVGIYDNPPLVFLDHRGEAQGICVDILNQVAQQNNWKLVYLYSSWSEALTRLARGDLDLLVAIAPTAERKKEFSFNAQTLLVNWARVYTLPTVSVASLLDLQGRRVGVLSDDIYEARFVDLLSGFNIHCQKLDFESYTALAEALVRGQVDAAVFNRLNGRLFVQKYRLQATPILFSPIELRVAAPLGKSQRYLQAIDEWLLRSSQDHGSAYYRIVDHWLGSSSRLQSIPLWVKMILPVFILVTGLGLAGIILLRTEIKTRTRRVQAEYEARLQAEQSVREKEFLLSSVFDAIEDLIAVKDKQLHYIRVNSALARFVGRLPEEIVGLSAEDLFGTELAVHLRSREELALQGRTVEEQFPLEDCTGHVHYFHDQFVPLYDHQGQVTGICSVARDITAQRNSELELRQARDAAESANRSKTVFLSNMSHEIRTPLNGMMGILQLLRDLVSERELKEYIDLALESGRNLLRLLNDILELSKIEAGRLDLLPEPFGLAEVMQNLNGLFLQQALEKGLELNFILDPGLPEVLVGDQGKLKQILFNLVSNALKYTDQGRVEVAVFPLQLVQDGQPRLPYLQADLHRASLLFVVSDTGLGISDEYLEKIFEPFVQGHDLDPKYGGVGLGLNIVMRLIELFSGSLCVESAPGRGSAFYLSLEFDLPAAEEGQEQAVLTVPDALGPGLLQGRILLAEDEKMNSIPLMRYLEKQGLSVELAGDGNKVLELLRKGDFDLVLMDIRMPFLDGLQAAQLIRQGVAGEEKKDIPIIALTAHAMEGDREYFLAQGLDDYLAKPVNFSDLLNKIKRYLPACFRLEDKDRTGSLLDWPALVQRFSEQHELYAFLGKIRDELLENFSAFNRALRERDLPGAGRVLSKMYHQFEQLNCHSCLDQARAVEEAILTGQDYVQILDKGRNLLSSLSHLLDELYKLPQKD